MSLGPLATTGHVHRVGGPTPSIMRYRGRMTIAAPPTLYTFFLSAALAMFGTACGSDPSRSVSVPTTAPTLLDTSAPAAIAVATGSAVAPSTAPDACSEVAASCHQHDSKGAGTTKIHECHELGHAHQLDVCVARKQECLDACSGHVH